MAIAILPEDFPPLRRDDPKRQAEARVFDTLQNLPRNGHAIYEFRCREGGRQLDFALWLDRRGRFALQAKGGTYRLNDDGQWYLIKPDGRWVPAPSPLERRRTDASNCTTPSMMPPATTVSWSASWSSRTWSATNRLSGRPATTTMCTSSGG